MKKAFTLLELMVVLLIIGVVLMGATPKIASRTVGEDPTLSFFDKLLKEAYDKSLELSQPVNIRGLRNSKDFTTIDGEKRQVEGIQSMHEVHINKELVTKQEFYITVYPDKICDYFTIKLDDDRVIESIPLLMTTRYKKKDDKK